MVRYSRLVTDGRRITALAFADGEVYRVGGQDITGFRAYDEKPKTPYIAVYSEDYIIARVPASMVVVHY